MKSVWLGIAAAILTGCAMLQPVEVERIDGLSELRISREGIEGALEVVLNNPNPVAIKAAVVDVTIAINGQEVGSVLLPYEQVIPRGDDQIIALTVQSNAKSLLSVLEKNWMILLKGEEFTVGISGTIQGSAMGVRLDIPVASEQNMKIL